jgi:hypothetical protein
VSVAHPNNFFQKINHKSKFLQQVAAEIAQEAIAPIPNPHTLK